MSIGKLVIDLIDANKALEKCRDEAGYNAGYFCHTQSMRVDDIEDAINAEIESKINEAINKNKPN